MSRVPTVRVVNPSQPDSYVIINESDFVQGKHQLYDPLTPFSPPEVAAPVREMLAAQRAGIEARHEQTLFDESDLRVAKGPGGKWFVWRGKQIVSGRLDSEDAALDALRNMREPVA